jgi:hypothetical protein
MSYKYRSCLNDQFFTQTRICERSHVENVWQKQNTLTSWYSVHWFHNFCERYWRIHFTQGHRPVATLHVLRSLAYFVTGNQRITDHREHKITNHICTHCDTSAWTWCDLWNAAIDSSGNMYLENMTGCVFNFSPTLRFLNCACQWSLTCHSMIPIPP